MPTFELYQTLGVATNATDVEIKKAYRRLAMKWHPDLHQDDQEKATEKFKEIQNAYSVLSDVHERRWYDQHGDENTLDDQEWNEEPSDLISDVKSYMRTSYFRSYEDDDPQNFYRMFDELFVKLETQETLYVSAQEKGNTKRMPRFGDSSSPYDSVKKFYREWGQFCSTMSFAWKDKWKISKNDPNINSWVRRQVEKENRAERRQAKQEFNSGIRSLVSWLRYRDRRILIEEERQKQEEREEKKRQEKQAKIDAELLKEIKANEIKDYGEGVENLDDDLEDDLMAYFELSKNKKKKANKKSNKKAKQNQFDDLDYVDEDNYEQEVLEDPTIEIDNLESVDELELESQNSKSSKKSKKNTIQHEEIITMTFRSKKKKKKGSKRFMEGDIYTSKHEEESPLPQSDNMKPGKKSIGKSAHPTMELDLNEDTKVHDDNIDNTNNDETDNENNEILSKQEIKRQKRQKRKEKKSQNELKCKVCGQIFSSRSKLFDHLKDTKHAVFK